MALISIQRDPSETEIRWFGLILTLFGLFVGAVTHFKFGVTFETALLIAGIALLAGLIYTIAVPWRRRIYVAWQHVLFPVGWTISTLLLVVVYLVVLTPTGLLLRMTGKGGIVRAPDASVETYWSRRPAVAGREKYFNQY